MKGALQIMLIMIISSSWMAKKWWLSDWKAHNFIRGFCGS